MGITIREIKPHIEKGIVKGLKSVGGNKKRVVKPPFLHNFQTHVIAFGTFLIASGALLVIL